MFEPLDFRKSGLALIAGTNSVHEVFRNNNIEGGLVCLDLRTVSFTRSRFLVPPFFVEFLPLGALGLDEADIPVLLEAGSDRGLHQIFVRQDGSTKFRQTRPTYQDILLWEAFHQRRRQQMLVVEPIFAVITLEHEVGHHRGFMTLLTVAVYIEEGLIILISPVVEVFLTFIKLTREG